MNAKEAHRHFFEQLKSIYSNNEAAVITDWVFEWATGWKRPEIISRSGLILEKPVYDLLQNKLTELLAEKPVQYVLGEAWFYNTRLKVSDAVLIPRPETEELVEWVIKDIKQDALSQHYLRADATAAPIPRVASERPLPRDITILDIGTGSGCIPVTLKKELPHVNVIALESSEKALSIARENATTYGLDIHFVLMDFLNENNWEELPRIDIIVSNPPYIPAGDLRKLDNNVALYEPHLALFVPDEAPLLFYEKIGRFGRQYLKPGGRIYVETHEDYTRQVDTLYKTYFTKAVTRNDAFNKSRMVKAIC